MPKGRFLNTCELARTYRIGVEFYDGRSHIGEFFQDAERYFSIGFWFEL